MARFLISIFLIFAINSASAISIKNGPYLTNLGENSAQIVWTTDSPAVSWVEIAPDDGSHFYACERKKYFDSPLGKKQIGSLHRITVDGLEKGRTYRYRIFSKEVVKVLPNGNVHYGDTASSDVYRKEPLRFKTADNSIKELSFLVVNDIHADYKRLGNLIKNIKNFDFLIMNGDMLSDMRNQEQIFTGFMDTVCAATNGEIPVFMARGNHETRGPFSEEFLAYFPTPTGKPYYSFRFGPVYFIFLDGGEDKPDSDIEYTDLADFDKYRSVQADWLKGVVESQEFKSAPVKLVITHIPPAEGSWHGAIDVMRKYPEILNNAGIDVIISGHLHRHLYIEGGKTPFKMPNVVNSNMEAVEVHIGADSIKLSFITPDGKKARNDLVFTPNSAK